MTISIPLYTWYNFLNWAQNFRCVQESMERHLIIIIWNHHCHITRPAAAPRVAEYAYKYGMKLM